MDMDTFEPEQEVAVPADLLQQEPLLEVVGIKPSTDLSDKVRLAAGISMTRLQTKTLSAAQQKRLTTARKMKEVTSTDKKPPWKMPSSLEMGAVGV
jgi:hypothetical protein